MARPVTLFTGQWADLPLTELAPMAKKMGFDGLELACWGDHFDVYKAAESKDYCHSRWKILTNDGLTAFGISNHLVGQAICDNIDERHQAILPPQVWGDGHPEGVRQRAAENMKTAARACRNFLDAKPHQELNFAPMVCGFTGSSVWHACYAFPASSSCRKVSMISLNAFCLSWTRSTLWTLTSPLRSIRPRSRLISLRPIAH